MAAFFVLQQLQLQQQLASTSTGYRLSVSSTTLQPPTTTTNMDLEAQRPRPLSFVTSTFAPAILPLTIFVVLTSSTAALLAAAYFALSFLVHKVASPAAVEHAIIVVMILTGTFLLPAHIVVTMEYAQKRANGSAGGSLRQRLGVAAVQSLVVLRGVVFGGLYAGAWGILGILIAAGVVHLH
ncbi:uncharacterized protein BDZ99DRAFT_569667 [Mytilinidion resinicola]|uniref:Uncharacterized protein n=1 Tax=Mytilinidion resinicola TaxID=574789 RepID=A0A6A6YRW7_9PEZI|nr:uncharacterized protein BDZ99DRAFT_569667 [Mytilinidion resinicola]KAF2811686.1 hypothetical protein BDZ99DRAFT_569667 [Mytilinidion resinicola]